MVYLDYCCVHFEHCVHELYHCCDLRIIWESDAKVSSWIIQSQSQHDCWERNSIIRPII